MKKLILLTLIVFMSISTIFSQTSKDSVYLIKYKDDMSGKTYIGPNRNFIVANENSTIGFKVYAYITNKFEFGMIMVDMVNIGVCNENDEIIILFENGSKMIKNSWKDFNCDGETYFNVSGLDLFNLMTFPISKIRMTNGYSNESFTGEVEPKDKRYFIQLFYALDNKLAVEE